MTISLRAAANELKRIHGSGPENGPRAFAGGSGWLQKCGDGIGLSVAAIRYCVCAPLPLRFGSEIGWWLVREREREREREKERRKATHCRFSEIQDDLEYELDYVSFFSVYCLCARFLHSLELTLFLHLHITTAAKCRQSLATWQ